MNTNQINNILKINTMEENEIRFKKRQERRKRYLLRKAKPIDNKQCIITIKEFKKLVNNYIAIDSDVWARIGYIWKLEEALRNLTKRCEAMTEDIKLKTMIIDNFREINISNEENIRMLKDEIKLNSLKSPKKPENHVFIRNPHMRVVN